MKQTAIGILVAAAAAAAAMPTKAQETSVSAAATYLYLATLCEGGASPDAANARQLGDILRRLGGSRTAILRAEMAVLHEIAEIENEDGSVDPARKAAFCAENKKVLTALAPEAEMWLRDLSREGEPFR